MKDFFNYQGKVCVVTGSSNGMGLATAKMLVELGAQVHAVSRSVTNIEGLAGMYQCDLSKKEQVDKVFAQLPGHIDCFFGVAGLSGAKTDYLTTFNCDFTSNKYMTEEYLVKRMGKGGSITFVSSTAGLNWEKHMKEQNPLVHAASWEETEKALGKLPEIAPANFAYIFAKRCVSQFAAEKALELGKLGIRVNNVMPGSTETGMKDEFEKMAGGEEALLNETGVAHRLASPDEMAGPIVFLGSDMCSFVSGVDFCVDSCERTQKILKLKKDVTNISATSPIILKFAKMAMDKQNRIK
ncbi:MAG: SDR family oxidoreductase [Clostridiales bacterium]|nr:SDR family oxidoreductase [Clostridiales bacterium]